MLPNYDKGEVFGVGNNELGLVLDEEVQRGHRIDMAQ